LYCTGVVCSEIMICIDKKLHGVTHLCCLTAARLTLNLIEPTRGINKHYVWPQPEITGCCTATAKQVGCLMTQYLPLQALPV